MSVVSPSHEGMQLFDRSRLFVDLDEATDPESPDSVLVVAALRGLGEPGSHSIVTELHDRFVGIVGDSGATYRTRSTEMCAILDGGVDDLVEVLAAIREAFADEADRVGVRVSTGLVALPQEADGAAEALVLADRRLAADGPIRYD